MLAYAGSGSIFATTMQKLFFAFFLTVDAILQVAGSAATVVTRMPQVSQWTVAYALPVQHEIFKPELYVIQRGMKKAIAQYAGAIVLDTSTPGGTLGTTFGLMETLGKFPGHTLFCVDKESMSTGAFIAANTGEICFSPESTMGAPEPVAAAGADMDPAIKQKTVSYLEARMRGVIEDKSCRAEVLAAMIDTGYELKSWDQAIKPKGKLLSLTAKETEKTCKTYGSLPPRLLGAGFDPSIVALLYGKFRGGRYEAVQSKVTWFEGLAQYWNAAAPVLLGLGLLAFFIELKVPGHGSIGAVGPGLLAPFFFRYYVAESSGQEPMVLMVLFLLGAAFVAVELFFFPGVLVVAGSGGALLLGSLLWAMADLRPDVLLPKSGWPLFQVLGDFFVGLAIAVVGGFVALRFFPKSWVLDRMVIDATVASTTQIVSDSDVSSLVGQRGVAATALRPGGQVEIAGGHYEARVSLGTVALGTPVRVVARTDFCLIVEAEA